MCLRIIENSQNRKRKIVAYGKINPTIKVWKIVRVINNKLYPIFYHKEYSRRYILGRIFNSNMDEYDKYIKRKPQSAVLNGIHVFLSNRSIEAAKKYLVQECSISTKDTFALIECVAQRNDLVAIGNWDNIDGIEKNAVFTKIRPVKIVEKFTLESHACV
jgi:hypothetical protein